MSNPARTTVTRATLVEARSTTVLSDEGVEKSFRRGSLTAGFDEIGSLLIGLGWLTGLLLVAGIVLARGGKTT